MNTYKSPSSRGAIGVMDHITFNQSPYGICTARDVVPPLGSRHFECFSCINLIRPEIKTSLPKER